ncbi:MAG: hypothetical protein ABIH34_07010 [Nanoarchaeota archaeon]
MKFQQEQFDLLISSYKDAKGAIYDRDARLFLGEEGTTHPPFHECNDSQHAQYVFYVSIRGKTLPLEHGMNSSMIDEERAVEPPEGTAMPYACASGLASHFDKPLEVLAIETEAKQGSLAKWNILLLRDIGDETGYIHNTLLRAMAKVMEEGRAQQ